MNTVFSSVTIITCPVKPVSYDFSSTSSSPHQLNKTLQGHSKSSLIRHKGYMSLSFFIYLKWKPESLLGKSFQILLQLRAVSTHRDRFCFIIFAWNFVLIFSDL